MVQDGSSAPRAPEPAPDDSHEGDRHEAPRGRGASRPKGDGGAKGKSKTKVRAAQGKDSSPAKGKKSSKGKVSSGKAPGPKQQLPCQGHGRHRRGKTALGFPIEHSRRRAGKRRRPDSSSGGARSRPSLWGRRLRGERLPGRGLQLLLRRKWGCTHSSAIQESK